MSAHFHFDVGGVSPIAVNVPNREALLESVQSRLTAREGFALATINLDHLVKLRSSEAFRRVYAEQDFVVADGNPIVWLSHVASRPVELAPGSDLVLPLAWVAAERGVSIALIGATVPVLEAAGAVLQEQVPGLKIVAKLVPSQNFDPEGAEAAHLLSELVDSGAGLALLALGAPRQETFAARGRALLPYVGFVSIGAGLDFLAGSQQRAPRWVQRIAMEWLWRMLSNPGRLARRYLHCALLLPRLLVAALHQRRVNLR